MKSSDTDTTILIDTPRLTAVLVGNGIKRVAASAGGALIGFYLAYLAQQGALIDAALVGALAVTFNSVELFAAIPMGMLSDRYSPRTLMLIGTLLGALATQLFGLSSAVGIFFVSRALEGLAAAAATPAVLTHLTAVTQPNPASRGRIFGLFEVSLLVGLALGGLVAGTLWDSVGTTAFSLVAGLYFIAAILFYWGASPKHVPSLVGVVEAIKPRNFRQALAYLREVLADRRLRRLAPAWVAVNAVVGLWLNHVTFQLTGPSAEGQRLTGGFTASQVGYLFLAYAIIFAVGIVGWGFALNRISRLKVMRMATVNILLATGLFYLLNNLIEMPGWLQTLLILLIIVTILFESGFTPAALAYLADLAGESAGPGTVMGLYSMLFGLGNLLGAALGGLFARSLAVNGLLLATALLALLGLVFLALLDDTGDPLPS